MNAATLSPFLARHALTSAELWSYVQSGAIKLPTSRQKPPSAWYERYGRKIYEERAAKNLALGLTPTGRQKRAPNNGQSKDHAAYQRQFRARLKAANPIEYAAKNAAYMRKWRKNRKSALETTKPI